MRRWRIATVCTTALVLAFTIIPAALADYGHDGGTVTSVTYDATGHVTVNWTHPPNDPNLALLGVGEEIETDSVWVGPPPPAGTDPAEISTGDYYALNGKWYEMPPNDDALATFTTPDAFAPGAYEALVMVADYERFDGNEWLYCPWNGYYFECKIDVLSAPYAFAVTDIVAPSAVPQFQATAMQRSVMLSWAYATDNVGVAGFRVFRDGKQIADINSSGYLDTGLAPLSTHSYTVQAYDAAGNVGPLSAPVTVTVPAAPTVKPKVKAKPKVTAICKDGTKSTKKSRRTACVGHKGVRKWLGSK